MSDYLGRLRTNDAYQELKQGVSDTLKKIPVSATAWSAGSKKQKAGSNSCYSGDVVEEMG